MSREFNIRLGTNQCILIRASLMTVLEKVNLPPEDRREIAAMVNMFANLPVDEAASPGAIHDMSEGEG